MERGSVIVFPGVWVVGAGFSWDFSAYLVVSDRLEALCFLKCARCGSSEAVLPCDVMVRSGDGFVFIVY